VVALDLTSSSWMIRPTEDEFDAISGELGFEFLGDELFTVVEIHLSWDSSLSDDM